MVATLKESFAEARARLPGGAAVDEQRQAAFEVFSLHGLPTKKLENWRYTDLGAIEKAGIEIYAEEPPRIDLVEVSQLLESTALPLAGTRAVIIDGIFSPGLSRLDQEPALTVVGLAADADSLADSLPLGDLGAERPLALLNSAFTRDGVLVTLEKNVEITHPLHVVVVATKGARGAIQPRIVIELGERSRLEVIVHFLDSGRNKGWTNVVMRLRQGRGSRLGFSQMQDHSDLHYHTGLIGAELAADAKLSAGIFDLGGCLTRNDIDVRLTANGASAEIFGVSLATAGQHKDNHIEVAHIAPDTSSSETFRAIAGARGRCVFNGKVTVHKDAQRIDARQRSDNLLLDETAEIDTKPELEIYADDVKCSHGATVGEIDEQHLFYLRSRGIDESAARALLTFAFANTVIDSIPEPALREHVSRSVAARLPEHEKWEGLA